MSHALRVGVADQIGYFRAYNTDGSAKTDLTSSTTGLALSVFRIGAAAVSISSLSAKAADNTAHADGAIRAVSGNLYTVDLPDAACADQVPSISVKGSYTGGVIEGPEHPLVGYNPASVAVGANTTAPATPTNVSDAQTAILAKLPAELVSGRMDSTVGAYQTGLTPLQPLVAGRQISVAATTGAVELDSADKATLVDLIWDEPLTGATHNVATSSGKRLRQTTAFQQIDSTVIDASATTTTFVTGLTSSVDNFYNDSMLVFTDGALAGQVRAIYDYIGAPKTIVLEEALTSAPLNGVAFAIVSLHIHPVSQIQSGLATSAALATESTKINRIEAVATGTVTGAGTSTEVFVGPSATLTITVDSSGNRSAVVVT